MRKLLLSLSLLLVILVGCGTTDVGEHEHSASGLEDRNKQGIILEDKDDPAPVEKDEEPEDEPKETDQNLSKTKNDKQSGSTTTTNTNTNSNSNAKKSINGDLTVHFIDAGQADATLFQTKDANILFDAGNWNRRDVLDYLNSINVKKIDLLIGSHPDADHIGQMSLILDQIPVEEVWMSGNESTSRTFERTIDKILEHGVNYHEPRAGESYQLGDISIDVISPKSLSNNSNEDSISIYLEYGNTSIVMTGDAGVKSEGTMINQRNLSADILHVGHHGSTTSTSEQFLKAVDPDYAIISAGKDNSYGHPHDEVVEKLLKNKIEIIATYQHGTVIFKSDGQSIKPESTIKQAFVPDRNEAPKQPVQEKKPAPKPAPKPEPKPDPKPVKPESPQAGCININTASAEELTGIIHIGEVRAEYIIELRPYKSVEDLTRVNGIGAGRLKDILAEQKACVR